MRFSLARRLALAALIPTFLVFSVVPGCSNESEGQRCGDEQGGPDSADCADGLTCVEAARLLNSKANRCCYTGGVVNDSRCLPSGSTGGTGATGGAIGAGGGAGAAPAAGGASAAAASDATPDAGTDDAATAGAGGVDAGSN